MNKIFVSFLASALIFSSLTLVFYSQFIGTVDRLSSRTVDANIISPLILSYNGALIIGVVLIYLIYNKTSKILKLLSLITILFSIIPFFLGASRGGIVALFFPFIILIFSNSSFKNTILYLALMALFSVVGLYLDDFLGSGLLDRFISISADIDADNSSVSRINIWKNSFEQFINNPVFGDKLNSDYSDNYPHNIFIEVLQTTGLIGFIPFIFLVYNGFIASYNIFKTNKKYSWIAIIFLQSITQFMFSGALYTAVWFWSSLALLLGFYYHLKQIENEVN